MKRKKKSSAQDLQRFALQDAAIDMALTWTERSNERGDRWLESGLWRINRIPLPKISGAAPLLLVYELMHCGNRFRGRFTTAEEAKAYAQRSAD